MSLIRDMIRCHAEQPADVVRWWMSSGAVALRPGGFRLAELSPARATARQMRFADLEPLRQGVQLEPVLQAIGDSLDKQPALVERVRRDLVRGLRHSGRHVRRVTL